MSQRAVGIAEAFALVAFISGGGCALIFTPQLGVNRALPIALVTYGLLLFGAILTYFLRNLPAKCIAGILTSGLMGAYIVTAVIDRPHSWFLFGAYGLFIMLVIWGINSTGRTPRPPASSRN